MAAAACVLSGSVFCPVLLDASLSACALESEIKALSAGAGGSYASKATG